MTIEMIEMTLCTGCGLPRVEDAKLCPHCATVAKYIRDNKIPESAIKKMNELNVTLERETGYKLPPIVTAVVYRLYHMRKEDA